MFVEAGHSPAAFLPSSIPRRKTVCDPTQGGSRDFPPPTPSALMSSGPLPGCRRIKAPQAAPGLLWHLPAQPLQHLCLAALPQLIPAVIHGSSSALPYVGTWNLTFPAHNPKKCLFLCFATSPVCSPGPLPVLGTDPACPTQQFLGVALSHTIPYPTDAIHIHRHESLPQMATLGHSHVPKFWWDRDTPRSWVHMQQGRLSREHIPADPHMGSGCGTATSLCLVLTKMLISI